MRSLSLGIEEFASERRGAQDRLTERLSGAVGAFLSTGVISDLKAAVAHLLEEEYRAETGKDISRRALNEFLSRMERTLDQTTADSSVQTTSLALSLAILNEAVVLAASDEGGDLLMEWVTMGDASVRETHQDVAGQQRPVGESFDVAGVAMPYPGWMGAPVALWINCRCVLRPALATDFSGRIRAMRQKVTASSVRTESAAKHDVIFVENRRTPKVVPKGEEYEPSDAEGKITKRRAATDEEEKTIANGDWLRVNEDGKKPGDDGYKEDRPSKVRPQNNSLAAAADVSSDSLCIVALPAAGDGVHEIGPEEKHATLVYFGEVTDGTVIDNIEQWVAQVAADAQPFTATVREVEPLGDQGAQVWLLDESDLNGIHEGLMANEDVQTTYANADVTRYPNYTPHVTIGYRDNDDEPGLDDDALKHAEGTTEIAFDRLAVWHGSDRFEYPLGENMADDETPEVDEQTDMEQALANEAPKDDRIPWHGVLAPEGVWSGDGRQFTNMGRTRDLPIPLTWQEMSAGGHDSSITVATIEKVRMIDGLMHASGYFLSSVDEADEVIGLISEFGKYGVSVDADDIVEMSFDEETNRETFDDPRVCSAAIVSIPAFAEAYVALGKHPVLDAEEGEEPSEEAKAIGESGGDLDEEIESQTAAADLPTLKVFDEGYFAEIEQFADLAPGKTEDGPGWLTHPVDTDRLRDYWVSGPGAAKIGWGSPGDFNRCRVNVAQYVKPQHLNGYCANRHYDALKTWPGRHAHAAETLDLSKETVAPALSLVAAGGWSAPSEFFAEPTDEECPEGKGIVFTDEGRVFGYVAEWGVCHVGLDGVCTEAPPSNTDYGYFRTGEINTPDGPVEVGTLTYATGHAGVRLAAGPAISHYDNTGTAWAYVVTGENERGIWFSGMLRPGLSEDALGEVKASGRLSGDWRKIGGSLELVAALSVNTPGFPVTKTSMVAGAQVSLVAAGMVGRPKNEGESTASQSVDVSLLATAVVDEIENRKKRRDRMAALIQKVSN